MKIKNWIACVQDRGKWKEFVERAKTFNQEVQRLEEEEEEEKEEEKEEEEEEEEEEVNIPQIMRITKAREMSVSLRMRTY